jgi:hypothetical protein
MPEENQSPAEGETLFDRVTPPVASGPSDPSGPIFEQALAILRGETSAPEPPPSKPKAPEPIPARMLNEFVYGPRLFHYEHARSATGGPWNFRHASWPKP